MNDFKRLYNEFLVWFKENNRTSDFRDHLLFAAFGACILTILMVVLFGVFILLTEAPLVFFVLTALTVLGWLGSHITLFFVERGDRK